MAQSSCVPLIIDTVIICVRRFVIGRCTRQGALLLYLFSPLGPRTIMFLLNRRNRVYINLFSSPLWHVKRCIIRFIYVIILSFLFVFTKGILLFYHCILLLYILSISIQCPFISIVYFSIYILYLIICIH